MSHLSIKTLNTSSNQQFTSWLADIFEHSSWIPERSWSEKPFRNLEQLHKTMVTVVEKATHQEKLSLLSAHPQLAGSEAKQGTLTNASSEEQSGANLNSLNKEEMAEITKLNRLYFEKHGFPFIIAVKNHNKQTIFSEFRRRLHNDLDTEFSTALSQVALIAHFRLEALLED